MAITAQAREFENSLVENAGAIGQTGQSMTQYLQDTDSYKSLTTQPLYMNILARATGISIPVAESTPVPHMGTTLFRPIPTPRVHDILDPSSNEQARADYLDRQMKHMKSYDYRQAYQLQMTYQLKRMIFLRGSEIIALE